MTPVNQDSSCISDFLLSKSTILTDVIFMITRVRLKNVFESSSTYHPIKYLRVSGKCDTFVCSEVAIKYTKHILR